MIKYDFVYNRAAQFRKKYGNLSIEGILDAMDIQLLSLPFGTGEHAMKGFVQRNSKCYTIAVNSDESASGQRIIIFHEIGHIWLKHLGSAPRGILHDTTLGYYNQRGIIADTENESNFFVAESLIDTEEAKEALHEYDIATAARQLHVPVEFLDYKLRMMNRMKIVNAYNDAFHASSDCLKDMDLGREGWDW